LGPALRKEKKRKEKKGHTFRKNLTCNRWHLATPSIRVEAMLSEAWYGEA